MVYNKLVRDNIPDIIRSQGETPLTRNLHGAEYTCALEQKLLEETEEFRKEKNLEELADILEVLYALTEDLGYTKEDLLTACREKHDKRGGFRQGVFLIAKEG